MNDYRHTVDSVGSTTCFRTIIYLFFLTSRRRRLFIFDHLGPVAARSWGGSPHFHCTGLGLATLFRSKGLSVVISLHEKPSSDLFKAAKTHATKEIALFLAFFVV